MEVSLYLSSLSRAKYSSAVIVGIMVLRRSVSRSTYRYIDKGPVSMVEKVHFFHRFHRSGLIGDAHAITSTLPA